jgi:hypothetical protein
MKHIHHDKYLQALEEIDETSWSEWEERNPFSDSPNAWFEIIFNSGGQQPSFYAHCEYRKPLKKRYLKRTQLPEPVRELLKDGQGYYIPNINEADKYGVCFWCGDEYDHRYLKLEMIYLKTNDAIAHTDALLATETD